MNISSEDLSKATFGYTVIEKDCSHSQGKKKRLTPDFIKLDVTGIEIIKGFQEVVIFLTVTMYK